MASGSTSVGDVESENMDDDGKDRDKRSDLEEGSGDAPQKSLLKREDSGILLDNSLTNNLEDCDSKSPSVSKSKDCDIKSPEDCASKSSSVSLKDVSSDADMNDSEWLNDSAVPLSSLSESGADTKSEGSPSSKDVKDALCVSEKLSCDNDVESEQTVVSAAASPACDKYDTMSVDCDDAQFTLDSTQLEMKSPQKSGSSSSVGGSPGCKRVTTDDEDSPRSKRQTPERWDEEEEETDTAKTTSTSQEGDPSADGVGALDQSEDVVGALVQSFSPVLPDHRSDDRREESSSPLVPHAGDDESSDSDRLMRSVLRRRRRSLRRLSRRLRSSSSEDSSEEEAVEVNDVDTDDEDESTEEVKKAVADIMNKTPPKPNWFALSELNKREYGMCKINNKINFNERVQGSLEMVRRLKMFDQMKYHEGCVNALSFNRIGTLLASGSDDLNIVLWNWQRSRPSLIYDSGHRSNVFQAKFMPFSGDCHVISCARDGQVRLAELSLTGVCKATRKLANHRGAVHKLALEMDSPNVFLSCGEDAVTFLFDLREDRPHRLVTTKENEKKVPLYSIHSNPTNSNQFCVGGRDHYIRVYDKRKIAADVDDGVYKKLCPDHLVDSEVKANVTCASYNYNGTEILGSYNDEDIYLWDNTHTDGANFIHRYTGHRNNATVKGVNFYGPRSEFIVSGSDCGNIYFWDKETEAIVNFQQGDEAGVINVLEPHPTLPILATSGLDHEVKLWMPSSDPPEIDKDNLKKTLHKNHVERSKERVAEPEMIGGQMLWFLMHHFRNSARRRMRAEGYNVSSSDDDDGENSDEEDANNETQCAQS